MIRVLASEWESNMGWILLVLVAIGVVGASAEASDVRPLPVDLPPVDDSAARNAAQQLATIAASAKPSVRSGRQSSPLVRECQRRMGDTDPDGRLGPMTRALAARYGVVIP